MSDVKHKAQRSEPALTPQNTRWAYPFVHEKRTKRANGKPLDKPRYDATGLLPKLHSDPAQCPNYQFLAGLVMQAATKAWGSWPEGGHWPIQDGDAPVKPKAPVPGQPVAPVDPNKYAWRKGHWVFEVTSYTDPGPRVAVLQGGQAVEIPAKVISGKTMYKGGDYGIGSIHAYTFQNEKFGVNFGFEGILWTQEGEAIGSSGPRSAAAMFGGVATFGAPAAPAAPVAPAVPAVHVAPPAPPPMPAVHVAPPIAPVAAPVAPPAMPAIPGAPALPPFPSR
jgi:hypothetical protein